MLRLKTLIPEFLKRKYNAAIRNRYYPKWYSNFLNERILAEKRIPKYELEQKHIENIRVLLSREELLRNLPKGAVCCEIGVNKGEFSNAIFDITTPKKLHLIDSWGDPSRYHDGLKLHVQEKFAAEIKKQQIEINVGFSTEVLNRFPDQYFDWVYLDTGHTYDLTAQELEVLKKKVKANGIIAGHDFTIGNWSGDCRYGVIEAVYELCVKDGWEIIFITSELNLPPSFAIKKIK